MFSAFATADEIVFFISLEILLSEKDKFLIAISTFFPTIDFKIGFNFLVLDLIFLFTDLTIFLSKSFFFILFHYFLPATTSVFAFLSAGVCPKNCLVGANSPSLWPTISSEIVIGINFFTIMN